MLSLRFVCMVPPRKVRKRLFHLRLSAGRRVRLAFTTQQRQVLHAGGARRGGGRLILMNACSIKNKISSIHAVIRDERLDLFAITNTWVSDLSSCAVNTDIAPVGFAVHHVHGVSSKGWGGGWRWHRTGV